MIVTYYVKGVKLYKDPELFGIQIPEILTKFDKRVDLNFNIKNFPFLISNISSSPAYGVFISQLIQSIRTCSYYGRRCEFYICFSGSGISGTFRIASYGNLLSKWVSHQTI